MKHLLVLATLLILSFSRTYPLYSQCDSRWAGDRLGTSPTNTICKAGCLISSASMALSGIGKNFNPCSINAWLNGHNGYVSDDLFVWASINELGLKFVGFIANSNIASNLNVDNVVILNVNNGGHWVLATGISGNTIYVNDPGYSRSSYDISQVVNGNTGLYYVPNSILDYFVSELEYVFNVEQKKTRMLENLGINDRE